MTQAPAKKIMTIVFIMGWHKLLSIERCDAGDQRWI